MHTAPNQCDTQTEVFVCTQPSAFPSGGGVLVVAGCVSVARGFGDVKNHLSCDVVTSGVM